MVQNGWNRIGIVVMLLFDPSDVPLHTAKMFKYLSEARPGLHLDLCADIMFGIFMLSFFTLRLVLYPYVVWSAHFESAQFFEHGPEAHTCVALLGLLLLLNMFWGYLILRVLHKLIVTGHVDDDRSDDEDEIEDKSRKDD